MLQKLADESDKQGLKMNKSKTKVMMETDTPIYVNNTQIDNFESMCTSSNDIRRRNMGTHHPSKEQASSRTNKDGKEYVKHHIPGQKKTYR